MLNFNPNKLSDFADFCGDLWCEWHHVSVDLAKMEIRIISDCSKWIIHINDFDKFGGYILWHFSNDTEETYHKQHRYVSIYNAIANALAHDFHKKYSISFGKEDLERLRKDFSVQLAH